jgi:hypothetical protein
MRTKLEYRDAELNHFSQFYSKYSEPIYGLIARIVNNKIVAEKIFLKVFKDTFVHNNIDAPKLVSKFIAVTNHARKKSLDTSRALTIFRACNEGRVCISTRNDIKSKADLD